MASEASVTQPALPDVPISLQPEDPISPSEMSLSPAEMSRAACHAVHQSVKNGDVRDAYFIVNSLRYSNVASDTSPMRHIKGLRQAFERFGNIAIQFGQCVPARLSCHALLHELIRIGLSKKAFKLSTLMMENGIPIRTRTLEAVIHALLPKPPTPIHLSAEVMIHVRNLLKKPDVLKLRPTMAQDKGTRCALELMKAARVYRYRRTDTMIAMLAHSFMLQGEILVASLFFVMIVKDWAQRKALDAQHAATLAAEAQISSGPPQTKQSPYRHAVFPSRSSLQMIVSSIDNVLSRDGDDEASLVNRHVALQALANLAVLLDLRQIPFPEIAPLISVLYKCPKVEDEIWITDEKGQRKQVKAYAYFHATTNRLISSLPTTRLKNIDPRTTPDYATISKSLLPPLDRKSYNTLLNYALRHRMSPSVADHILTHMTKTRGKPLNPDVTTYNIIARAGTLLRRPDITEQAIEGLARMDESSGQDITSQTTRDYEESVSPLRSPDEANRSKISKGLRRITTEGMEVPMRRVTDRGTASSSAQVDVYSISTLLTHIVSTSQPDIVVDVLFRLIPELSIVDHPSWGYADPEDVRKNRARTRIASIRRAVAFGPYFFTAILNALRKAGKTGLAERVWLLAKDAERASWIPEINVGGQPWCLPTEAYTSMLQCYGSEASKRPAIRKQAVQPHELNWEPREKRFVVGWARFVLERGERRDRDVTGRSLSFELYRAMSSGAQEVYEALKQVQNPGRLDGKRVQIPKPDARFYNAMLDVVGRPPHSRSRNAQNNAGHWRRHLRFAKMLYADTGRTPHTPDPLLVQVTEDMMGAGIPVPIALRYLLVGRTFGQVREADVPLPLNRRPYAFPERQSRFHSHTIPVHKSKGLPLGRRTRKFIPYRLLKSKACTSSTDDIQH